MESESLSFVPSRVDGLADVTRVTIYPDRVVFDLSDSTRTFLFGHLGHSVGSAVERIANWLRLRRPRRIIGERDWFHPPPKRFFRFYTDPPITVYMPADDAREYGPSVFFRVQRVWRSGRIDTFDLG